MSLANTIYNEQITYHSKKPRNFREMEDADQVVNGNNPLCGDSFVFYLKVDENNTIQEITFTGKGCAISTASASMMTKFAKGKNADDINVLFTEFQAMSTGKLDVDTQENHLGNLKIFKGVQEFPVRVKCATLPWHTLNAAMNGKKEASTE